jgi:hypothetical protein
VVSAQAWSATAVPTTSQSVRVPICTGVATTPSGSPPSPTTPAASSPQHHSAPPVTPQVWPAPAATEVHDADDTLTGASRSSCSPSPIAPRAPRPQHHSPSSRVAQVWAPPAWTLSQVAAGVTVTSCGIVESPRAPDPS